MAFLLTLIGGFLSALNIVSRKGERDDRTDQRDACPESPVPALQADTVLGYRLILLTIGACIAWLVYGLVAGRQYGDHLSVCGSLPDGVYRFRPGYLVRVVHPATGDVHGFLFYDYFCPSERYVYTGQQYAGLGTGTDTCQSAPLFSRSDANGLSERQHFVRPHRALHCRLPVRPVL